MLRLWIHLNWNLRWSTKMWLFAKITIAQKKNNVSIYFGIIIQGTDHILSSFSLCYFRQASFQWFGFSRLVHYRQSSNWTRYQGTQANMWNQWMPHYASIEPTIAQLWCKYQITLVLKKKILSFGSGKFSSTISLYRKIKYFVVWWWEILILFQQQLPVKIYESVIDIVQGEATMLFVNLSYTLATEEAERIGVDHVVRTSTHENGGKSAGE